MIFPPFYRPAFVIKIYIIFRSNFKTTALTHCSEKKKNAKTIYEKINKKEYLVKKLSTENNELYGSVKPTEISKLILELDRVIA